MKSGDKVTAEKHGLQARIAGWREDAAAAKAPGEKAASNPELEMAGAKPQPVKLPANFLNSRGRKRFDIVGSSSVPAMPPMNQRPAGVFFISSA